MICKGTTYVHEIRVDLGRRERKVREHAKWMVFWLSPSLFTYLGDGTAVKRITAREQRRGKR